MQGSEAIAMPVSSDTKNKPAQQTTVIEVTKSEQVGIATVMPAAQMERKKIDLKYMAKKTIAMSKKDMTTTQSSARTSTYSCATASDIRNLASVLRHRPPMRLTVGVLVRHEQHGVGKVTETRDDDDGSGDGYVTVVSFDPLGGDGSTHKYRPASQHKLHVIDQAAWDSIVGMAVATTVNMAVATTVNFHTKSTEKKQPGHKQETANKRSFSVTVRSWVGQLRRRLGAKVEGVQRSCGAFRKSSLGFIVSSALGAMVIMVGIQLLALMIWPSCTPGVSCKHKRSREHQHSCLIRRVAAHTTRTQCTRGYAHTVCTEHSAHTSHAHPMRV